MIRFFLHCHFSVMFDLITGINEINENYIKPKFPIQRKSLNRKFHKANRFFFAVSLIFLLYILQEIQVKELHHLHRPRYGQPPSAMSCRDLSPPIQVLYLSDPIKMSSKATILHHTIPDNLQVPHQVMI